MALRLGLLNRDLLLDLRLGLLNRDLLLTLRLVLLALDLRLLTQGLRLVRDSILNLALLLVLLREF